MIAAPAGAAAAATGARQRLGLPRVVEILIFVGVLFALRRAIGPGILVAVLVLVAIYLALTYPGRIAELVNKAPTALATALPGHPVNVNGPGK